MGYLNVWNMPLDHAVPSNSHVCITMDGVTWNNAPVGRNFEWQIRLISFLAAKLLINKPSICENFARPIILCEYLSKSCEQWTPTSSEMNELTKHLSTAPCFWAILSETYCLKSLLFGRRPPICRPCGLKCISAKAQSCSCAAKSSSFLPIILKAITQPLK